MDAEFDHSHYEANVIVERQRRNFCTNVYTWETATNRKEKIMYEKVRNCTCQVGDLIQEDNYMNASNVYREKINEQKMW